jgi:PAS domain S-box-containing protein
MKFVRRGFSLKSNFPLIKGMQLGLTGIIAILIVIGLFAYRDLITSTAAARWAQHTNEVLEHLVRLRSTTEDIERGYREFTLSGDETYLRMANASIVLAAQERKALGALTVDNPRQQTRVGIVGDLTEQIIHRHDKMPDGIAGQGDPLLGEFRAVARDMEIEERGLLAVRNADSERGFRQTRVALSFGGALALLIAAIAGWLVPRAYAAGQRTQAALLSSEDRMRILIQGVEDYAIFMLDPQGKVVTWNAGAERIKGYKAHEIIGENFSRFYTQEDVTQGIPFEELRIAAASGSSISEHLRVRKDGSQFWAKLVLTAARDKSAKLLGFSEISHDITERKRAEANYERALENALDGMLVVNQAGEIVSLNVQAERQFGYYRDDLVGRHIQTVIPRGVTERLSAVCAEVTARTRSLQMGLEIQGRRSDGSDFPIEIMLTPRESAEGILMTVAIRDLTERKNAERLLAATGAELQRSNDELGQFASIASHDLQEPLRMVASYTRLLATNYHGRLDSDADEFIAFAVDGCDRMQQMIRDLLTYSRAGSERPALANISSEDTLREALVNLRAAIQQSGAVVTHDSLPEIMMDRGQLIQVFQNLIGNAIKYHNAGVPRVHVSALAADGGQWIFSVRDNGLGIDADEFDRIFVLFQRLHAREEFAGTGIGLSICKKVLERLGGKIWVESTVGEGSTFHFTVPNTAGADRARMFAYAS